MNIKSLISEVYKKYPHQKELFYIDVVLKLIHNSSLFNLLDTVTVLKERLQELRESLIQQKHSRQEFDPFEELAKLNSVQRAVLSCPHDDEHVILLSCLKALENMNVLFEYKNVLREILLKNLHKVENDTLNLDFAGRAKEIDEITRVLGRSIRNNVIIVGPTGVGKTTLAKHMKQKLLHKVFQLFPGSSIFYDQVVSILADAQGGKVTFFLDEIFTFEPGHISYTVDNAQVIGTANDVSFRKFAQDNPGIVSKFEVVRIEEPVKEDLEEMLKKRLDYFISTEHMEFEKEFLEELIELSARYMPDASFPAKGISVLEESVYYAQSRTESITTKEILKTIISSKTNIPIGSISDIEKKDLSQLSVRLSEKVKGQDTAIKKVSAVIQRSKLGLGQKHKPIGSFLFVGPSGVGKTELAKALAHEIFGDTENMVRIDMSEFAESHTVQRLIGAPPGYIGFEEGGQLTNPIKQKPYNLVLLDEIEKAHPRIFDIFLQVLDDGRLTDGQGKVVDFKNTIIIATSNAGIEDILDLIAEGKKQSEIEKEVKDILQDYFRVEFINRFDEVIIFNSLEKQALEKIALLQVEKLKQELSKRSIEFDVSEETLKRLAEEGHDPRYGARGLIRLLQEKIENTLAEMIISGKLKEGERVVF